MKPRSSDKHHRQLELDLEPRLRQLLPVDKGELSFEAQPCRLSWPDEFDKGLVQKFVDAVRNARRIPLDQSMEQVLELRRLGRIRNGEFTPNLACGLLFAIDPGRIVPGCKIRFLRFEGEVEGSGRNFNAVKDEIIEGPLPRLLADFEKVLESQLRTFSPLDASMKFFPVREYPKEAWYEAIVNACVHRSYGNGLKNMPIFVKMFDDHLVIESPGPFPPFVTPENIFERHHPRNPHLMDAMFYLDFVRCAREGTRRIRDTMKELKLPPPEFAERSHDGPPVVRVTLRNNVKQRRAWIDRDVSQIIGEALASKFSEHERRVLNLVAANGTITISDAHKVLDISWASAKRLLLSLARQHVLQYVRFRPMAKDKRDPRAFFRLWSTAPLPDGAFEPDEFKTAPRGGKSSPRH